MILETKILIKNVLPRVASMKLIAILTQPDLFMQERIEIEDVEKLAGTNLLL